MPQHHWMCYPEGNKPSAAPTMGRQAGNEDPSLQGQSPLVDFFAKTALPRNKQQTFQRRNVNFPEMESKLSKGGKRVEQTTTIATPWDRS